MRKRYTLKDPQREIKLFTNRAIIVSLAIAIFAVILLVRLWYLQVYQHQLYMTLSQQNQLNLLPLEPNRGLIYDRNGLLIAENTPVFSLEVIPGKVNSIKATVAAIEKVIALSDKDKKQFFRQLNQRRRFETIPLKTRLSEEEMARFAVNQYRFPGVTVKARMARYYPYDKVLQPVLGYVGRINERELAKVDPNNYSATNFIGKLGIEKFFEDDLHGKVGYQQAEVDATGRVVRVLNSVPPVSGKNLQLTIDLYLQQVAVAAFGDLHGAAVAIQPATGHVLALVSSPGYDPNLFVDGISTKDFQALQQDSGQPLYNRAIRGQYPPGSTVKPIVALTGLTTGTVTPEYGISDPGWFQLKNSSHIYHDWKRTGHGWVNLHTAIVNSCDTYFYTLANRMGVEPLVRMFQQFGLGKRTGIEIQEELPGLVPTPAWKKRTQGHPWYPGDTLITAIGQGFMLATPLQLAMAVATIANRGQVMKPTLIYSSQQSGARYLMQPAVLINTVPAAEKNWQEVIEGMRGVMVQGTGLGHYGRVNYEVAGKTGTAQVFSLKQNQRYYKNMIPKHLRDNSLFIAFAPIDKPQIAVAVMVEHSDEAGSIARKMIDYYLFNRGKPPQLEQPPANSE